MQLSPNTKTIFQGLFPDPPKEQLFHFKHHLQQKARIKFIKMSIEKTSFDTNQRGRICTQLQQRKSSLAESHMTVITIHKPSHYRTIELSPEIIKPEPTKHKLTSPSRMLNKIVGYSDINSTIQPCLSAQKNKNISYKYKVYSQEHRKLNKYAILRKEFEQSVDDKIQAQLLEKQREMQDKINKYKHDIKQLDKSQLQPISSILEDRLRSMSKR